MKYVRIYTGSDGLSHFEDVDVPANAPAPYAMATESIIFRTEQPGHFSDWHTAPRRQFLITIGGQVEIHASDGEVRRFGAGGVMLADDSTGKGHTTRIVGDEPRVWLTVPLAK